MREDRSWMLRVRILYHNVMLVGNEFFLPVYPGKHKNAVPHPEDGKYLDNPRYDIFIDIGPYLIIDHVQ